MAVDAPTAEWLRSPGLSVVSSGAAAWGDIAATSEIGCCLSDIADAQAEADRQRAFFGAPRAIETLMVPGAMLSLLGRAVTIFADAEGYRAGSIVFVIGVAERDDGMSTLTVIRRLA